MRDMGITRSTLCSIQGPQPWGCGSDSGKKGSYPYTGTKGDISGMKMETFAEMICTEVRRALGGKAGVEVREVRKMDMKMESFED